jgi:cobalt-zinc-cadmium resistance protein CzcA
MRFNELMTGARQDVVLKLYGEDLDTLSAYAKRIGALTQTVEGATNVYVETVSGLPQIVVKHDRAALARYGLDVAEVDRVVHTAFAGSVAGQVYEGERRFDLVVRAANQSRTSVEDVQGLLVPTPNGQAVPLSLLADVRIIQGPNQIQRENAQRRIIVGFNVRGRDVESIVKELQGKVEAGIKLPPAYFITYGGQFENLLKARARLMIVVPVALLLILLLLYFAFGSVQLGLLVFSAVPLSAIGGVFALWIRDMPFSISAGVGFIALFGVAVLNGIVLVNEFEHLRKNGLHDVRERIAQGTRVRLRPVLMTAAVASLGFMPMAISMGAGAEVQRPLATVVIGGLISATSLTLLVLPALYLMVNRRKSRKEKGGSAAPAIAVIALLLLVPSMGIAQSNAPRIGLQQAVDSAMKNNPSLREAALRANAESVMVGSGWNIPKTSAGYEYGQINTENNDEKLSLKQEFAFPTVYVRQRQVLKHTAEGLRLELVLRQREVRARVREHYYRMLLFLEEQKLLREADSLYTGALQGQERRFALGDVNVLQRSSARTQQLLIRSQLQQVNAELERTRLGFAELLNTPTAYLPENIPLRYTLTQLPGDEAVQQHPLVQAAREQQGAADARWQLEKARWLPDLSIGWTQQTLRGSPAVSDPSRIFGNSDKFTAVQAGISVPLFFGGQQAKAKAARIGTDQAESGTVAATLAVSTRLQQARQRYQAERDRVNALDEGVEQEAGQLRSSAAAAFSNGDISQLEWTLLTGQAIDLSMARFDALLDLSRAAAALDEFNDR